MEGNVQSPALTMRIMKIAFLVSAFLFIYVAIKIPVQPQPPVSQPFELVIAIVALTNIAVGFVAPRFLFKAAERTSQNKPASAPLNRWMAGNLVSLACFEACILFGLVLHFLQARVRLVELLFSAGIVAMLFWSPGVPPGQVDAEPGAPS